MNINLSFWKRPAPKAETTPEPVTIQYFDNDKRLVSKTVSAARYAELLTIAANLECDESLEFNYALGMIR